MSASSNQSRKKPKTKRTKNNKKNKNGFKYKYEESKRNYNNGAHEQEESYSEESITRIWICSWNMAAKDHFKFRTIYDGRKIPDENQTQKFEQIVPTNYDLYVFGVQEGVSDTFFQYISLYLSEFEVTRIPLSNNNKNGHKNTGIHKNSNCFGVHGRGDGSFLSTKFTGIAIYYRKNLSPYISLKSKSAVSCGMTQGSKGAACILLKIYSTTIVFLSTHMSSNSTKDKLDHFKILVNKAGDTLGCSGMDLLTQFHHIIWFGDLNYRITALTADNVLQNMALGNLNKLWDYDSLKMSRQQNKQCAFKNFKEPIPRLDFYPTYKKKPNRQLDFDQNPKELKNMSASSQQSSLSQLDKIYTTKYKEPFYKGGTVQDRIPSFCDRVLYHTISSITHLNRLQPELDTGVLNCVEFSYKKDKCNNYGCIPHHLMGSDHSAIYCGLILKSPILFPCPPHELNDAGLPKSYQLKIIDIKIIKKSPYHQGSTYSEYPIKTKILFPLPYEIENFKYKNIYKPYAYTILQNDLEMYHNILRQIQVESKRRLSQQKNNLIHNKKDAIYPLITPQVSTRHSQQQQQQQQSNNTQDTLIRAKPVIDKGLNSKKIKKETEETQIDDDEDWNEIPAYDILTNPEVKFTPKTMRSSSITNLYENSNKQSPSPLPSPNRMINDNNNNNNNNNNELHDNRRESAPNIKKKKMPSNYIFKSEDQMDIEKQQINKKNKYRNNNNIKNKPPIPTSPLPHPPKNKNNKQTTTPLQLSPKNSTTSPAANGSSGFRFSFDYNDNKTFNLSNNKQPLPTSPKPNKRNNVMKRVSNKKKSSGKINMNNSSGGIGVNNPLHVYLNNNNNDNKQSPLSGNIKDNYFENDDNNDIDDEYEYGYENDSISPIKVNKKTYNFNGDDIELFDTSTPNSTSQLQRTRSKSMGSFAETMECNKKKNYNILDDDVRGNNHNMSGHHTMARSDLMSFDTNMNILSGIYKDLAEIIQKLTIISFGPSRRPTHGNIHCCIKVETNDFKGQCCIPFQWTDFGKEVENVQYAELSYHGVPLYDKTGSPVKCKIHYKLSLIDKQIVFRENN